MKRILILTVVAFMATGCAGKLDDDWLALDQKWHAVIGKLVEFERVHRDILAGSVEKHFALLEAEIARREAVQFLDPRTVTGADGIPRVMVEGPDGAPVAVSRADVERYVAGVIEAQAQLAAKRAEWTAVLKQWDDVLDKVEAANGLQIATAEDLHAAKESAQAVLEQLTAVVGSLTAATAAFFLGGA